MIYLREAAVHFRSHAEIEISHCGRTDPLGIVQDAAKRKNKFEHIFCAVDRDSHANFLEAARLAQENDIEFIASYPSYEFWLLLHFLESRKPYAAAGGRSAADHLVGDLREIATFKAYEKGRSEGLFKALVANLPQAKTNARRVLAQAMNEGELNPSTRLHDLVEHLEALGKPIAI